MRDIKDLPLGENRKSQFFFSSLVVFQGFKTLIVYDTPFCKKNNTSRNSESKKKGGPEAVSI